MLASSRGRGRPLRRRPGADVGGRRPRTRPGRRTLLDDRRAGTHDDPLCQWPCGRQRGHAVSAAGAESHARARAAAAGEPGHRRCDAALRPRLDRRDDRASRANGHRHPCRDREREPVNAQRGISARHFQARELPRRAHRRGSLPTRNHVRPSRRGGRGRIAELERRIAQEPGVVAVTFADRVPGVAPANTVVVSRPRREPDRRPTIGSGQRRWGPDSSRHSTVRSSPGVAFHDGDRASRGANSHRQRGVRARLSTRSGTADRRSALVCAMPSQPSELIRRSGGRGSRSSASCATSAWIPDEEGHERAVCVSRGVAGNGGSARDECARARQSGRARRTPAGQSRPASMLGCMSRRRGRWTNGSEQRESADDAGRQRWRA